MRFRLAAGFISAVILSGCAAPAANLSFSVPNVGYATKKLDAELRSMTVTVARNDERKAGIPMDITDANIPQMWQTALQEALNKMAIFKDDASQKVNLSVKILGIDVPAAGFSMTTTTIARYELIDRANGAIIYAEDVSAAGVVPADYAFMGLIRARESVNRSVQANISQFLQALQNVDTAKPMFPNAPMASK